MKSLKETSRDQWRNLPVGVRLKMETKISETCKKAGNNEVVSIKPSLFV